MRQNIFLSISVLVFTLAISGCAPNEMEQPLFVTLDKSKTGLDFANKLTATNEFNVFKYMYFYNGAGVGAGDFNNDGLIDLFFSANQQQNKLFLNSGELRFNDVSDRANIPNDSSWSTGVSVIDINNDGLLDIYVCRVGKFETLNGHNQLLICQGIDKDGIPTYLDKAKEYNVDFSGFCTQAAFLDYDMDGDLDLFLLNHSVHQNGTFAARSNFLGTYNELSGDRLYKNEGNRFVDITKESGINSSAISYGLGISVADINLDGYPDLYIGNDFHENDYLYINQHNGTFREEATERLMHTSQFSMGVDVADINNDGYPEIISMDMLPSDPYILKRSLGEDAYDIFNMKIRYGYNYQYTRNNLQLNRKNGMFSETGLYSGVFATDWSWAPLWVDFDNDGLKDLFVSNGIPKRLNDIDYVSFVSNTEVQKKIRTNSMDEKDMALIEKFPQIKLPNKFFRNNGDVVFDDQQKKIRDDKPTYSNGAVYADFDNDGDLDIVVNNIEDAPLLYQNKSNDKNEKKSITIKLKGSVDNVNALGAKVFVFVDNGVRTYEKYPVRGFQSSMEIPLLIGIDKARIDSMIIVWPDNSYERFSTEPQKSVLQLNYKKNLPQFNYSQVTSRWAKNSTNPVTDITQSVNLNYLHHENSFVEFDREPLIPHMISTESPALAVADINHDGLEDIFIGSARDSKSAIFLQDASGKFHQSQQASLSADSGYEDVDACWVDVNNDGNIDLVVASGGNEYYGTDKYLLSRVYLNNGKSEFIKLPNAIDSLYLTASCVTPLDFNGDGYMDLFLGSRAIPWEYGKIPQSYLLQNDKTGKFKNVTEQFAKDLSTVGFVTGAQWVDLDNDGDKDLLLSLEWGALTAFINNKGTFTKKILSDKLGWWNFILPVDIDNDGDLDLIAGNLGLNSRLKASEKEPVRLYYNDFDDNGKKEQVLTYYLEGKEKPFANKSELDRQIPIMKKKFLYAEQFAKASLNEMFKPGKLEGSEILTANYFSNAVFINNGNMQFSAQALPWAAQLTSYKDAVVINANNDSLPDILLVGNYYANNIEMGRYDADFGTVLVNRGKGQFSCENINGLVIKGQTRHIRKIEINKQEAFVLVRNSDSAMVIRINETGK